ncbi:MAG: DUF4832 domain-containing protein, partial [Lachnospiraceae bacterium]|nr:DUF4832 domain-containing protein [Lachnospiraceae bacterium]
TARRLYPMDTFAAYAVTRAIQRYGQNERSLFSFLNAKGPHSISGFTSEGKRTYNLAEVYDYVVNSFHSYLNDANSDSTGWSAIRLSIERVEGADWKDSIQMLDAIKMVKAIGLLNLFGNAGFTMTQSDMADYAIMALGIESANSLLHELIRRKIIRYAEYKKRLILFEGTDINIEQEMTNAYAAPYTVKQAVFDPVYDQKTGAEYFRDRLGYRLVLREAYAGETIGEGESFSFRGKIQNVGFGNIVNRKAVTVILKGEDGTVYTAPADVDVRSWKPDLDSRADNTSAWRDLSFEIPIAEFGEVPSGNYQVFLKICDPKEKSANKRCIRFANKGTDNWDEELGANLIARTVVG